MRKLCATLICIAGFTTMAHAIGVRTHSEMAERAMDNYLLPQPPSMFPGMEAFFRSDANRRAIYSGNAWTDWGYGGVNHQAGEDGHWFPFLNAYAALLKERYPTPWTPEAEREIAFFLGTLCHSITDLPWHFGNAEHPSFIQAATAADGSGHVTCDFSSDILTHTSQTLYPPMGLDDFFYPLDTVYAVYQRFGNVPSRKQMETGSKRERAMWITGEKKAINILDSVRERSPWVVKNMEGYYFGGVQNNAANAAHWFRYYYAFLQGWTVLQNSPEFANGPPGYLPYSGTQDATLLERVPNNNTGAEPYLAIAGNGPGDKREVRLRFDLSGATIPSISKATLWLYIARRDETQPPGDKEIACYAVAAPWEEGKQSSDSVEGSEGLPAVTGEITWGSVQPVANAPICTVLLPTSQAPGYWVAFDLTQAAQSWLASPDSNHGIALRETEASANRLGAIDVYASEAWKNQADGLGGGDRINYRPMLVLQP
jgi:hypothetical protein